MTLGTLFPDQRLHREGRQEATLAWQGSALVPAQVLRSEQSNIFRRIRHGQVARMAIGRFNIYFARCVLRCRPKRFKPSELLQPSHSQSLFVRTQLTLSIVAHPTGSYRGGIAFVRIARHNHPREAEEYTPVDHVR